MENGNQPATKADMEVLRADMKADMGALRADMNADMGVLRADMKADMGVLRADMKADMGALRADMKADMEALETRIVDRVTETMRDVQTELLKAFYSFTQSNQQRTTQLEGNQAALISRVGTLEERITELERKINFPQHPTQ